MLNTPFPPWPSFDRDDADAVSRVLLSNRVNSWTGEETRAFEREFAAFVGTRHAVAIANGTLALDAALRSLRIGAGDDVIVTPRSFMASVSCVVMAGANPIFADVDPDSQNLTAETIAAVLTPRTKAVVLVHLAGMPCDMDPIMALSEKHGFAVIEDCAQAHGARYKGRSVGSIGHIGAWSYCQDKIITTGGEGGMVTTDDTELWSRVWSLKDHGKSYEAMFERTHAQGFRWVHDSFGSNWRMLEMQSVIGRRQLRQLDQWSEARRANLERILEAARSLPGLRVPSQPNWATHAAYKAYLFVDPQRLAAGWTRDRIIASINDHGVPCYHGSCPEIYLEKAFDETPFRPRERLPVARDLGETSFMFLIHPTLENQHIEAAIAALNKVMAMAT